MAESVFEDSIAEMTAASVVPLMPGISPELEHRMKREFYKTGEPWRNKAPFEQNIILKEASKAGNFEASNVGTYRAAKNIQERFPETLTEGMMKRIREYESTHYIDGETIENRNKLKLSKANRLTTLMNEMDKQYYKNAAKPPPDMTSINKTLGEMMSDPDFGKNMKDPIDDLISPKNKKYSVWNSLKGYGKVLANSKLGKAALGVGKFAAKASVPLTIAAELDWSRPDNYFMPEYKYEQLGNTKLETQETIWE
jgi:hypothetical protein